MKNVLGHLNEAHCCLGYVRCRRVVWPFELMLLRDVFLPLEKSFCGMGEGGVGRQFILVPADSQHWFNGFNAIRRNSSLKVSNTIHNSKKIRSWN